jgi:hypothetical protein
VAPPRSRDLEAALAALILVAAAPSCERGGAPYDCACSYLTDFDDASTQPVRVCSPAPERAQAIARGCAQTGAPAPIQGCSCAPARGAAPCDGVPCLPAP